MNTAWERELTAFMFVDATVLQKKGGGRERERRKERQKREERYHTVAVCTVHVVFFVMLFSICK